MDIHVKIITGHSFFNPSHAIVGVSLACESDARGLTKLADDIGKTGRPRSVASLRPCTGYDSGEQCNGEFCCAANPGAALRSKWEDWAGENGHVLVWAPMEAVSDGF